MDLKITCKKIYHFYQSTKNLLQAIVRCNQKGLPRQSFFCVLFGRIVALSAAGIQLARTPYFVWVAHHFIPVRVPAYGAAGSKNYSKHFCRNAYGFHNNTGVEVYVRIKLFG